MANEFINKVILGDAIEIMKKIPDNSVDVAFADPPFNLGKKYNHYKDKKEVAEYIEWCKLWLKEMVRVTKPTGSIFVHNIPRWLTYYASYLNEIAYFRHWIAWNAMGAPLGKTLLPNHYGILWYTKEVNDFKFYDIRGRHPRCRKCDFILQDYGGKKDQMHPFGPLISDVWSDVHRIRHKKRRDEHPCQLPIPLLERLVLMTTDTQDIVLDPFVGTGTTAIAAKRLGRRYVAIDLDPTYTEITEKKLVETEPTKINGCFASIFLGKVVTIREKDWEELQKSAKVPKEIKEVEFTPVKLGV
jgi:site-specific DNA-methyltransferase (adenine-specific)